MSALEVLKKARELLSDESRWTKGAFARTMWGEETSGSDPEAECFCARGAITHFRGGFDAVLALQDALPSSFTAVSAFNDNKDTEHADVLNLFDRAIVKLEASND
jgi:hypothetical protein